MFPFTPHTTLRLGFGLGGSLSSGLICWLLRDRYPRLSILPLYAQSCGLHQVLKTIRHTNRLFDLLC